MKTKYREIYRGRPLLDLLALWDMYGDMAKNQARLIKDLKSMEQDSPIVMWSTSLRVSDVLDASIRVWSDFLKRKVAIEREIRRQGFFYSEIAELVRKIKTGEKLT